MYINFLTVFVTSATPHEYVTPLGSLTTTVNGSVIGVENTDATAKGIYLTIILIKEHLHVPMKLCLLFALIIL